MDIPSFSTLEKLLDFLLQQGIKNGVFPGGAAAVFSGHGRGRIQAITTCGQTRLDEKGTKIDQKTFFDLASLTKPLATTLLMYRLIEQGLLDWKDTYTALSKRKIPSDKKYITIAQLLSHCSGLPAYRPYFELFKPVVEEENKRKLRRLILETSLAYEIGAECRYSDLGFILLGDGIEQITGQSLDILFTEQIAYPLGLDEDLLYLPLSKKKNFSNEKFAATERCRWRNRIIQGEVHDEHCFLMGGVAGHAGLFGTIGGVGRLCSSLLEGWQGRETGSVVSGDILRQGLTRRYKDRTWCLGFDTPSTTGYTSAGTRLSRKSVGHLGYAGTSFWIDPDSDTVIVLLTNRVHPSRENTKIRQFRPWFHDRVMEFVCTCSGAPRLCTIRRPDSHRKN